MSQASAAPQAMVTTYAGSDVGVMQYCVCVGDAQVPSTGTVPHGVISSLTVKVTVTFRGELLAPAELTATVAEYVPAASKPRVGWIETSKGALEPATVADNHPLPVAYAIDVVGIARLPPPPFVMVTLCGAGSARPVVAKYPSVFAVNASAGGTTTEEAQRKPR